MPLVAPILDDRTYESLRDELVRRIPVYTPEWTNHNESDPGIALVELFSFLGESLLFRFNQLPDRTKLAFLNLLQIPPRPAQPARALVVAETDEIQGVQVLKGSEMKAGSVSFETEDEVYAWPLDVTALGKVGPIEELGDAGAQAELEADRAHIAKVAGLDDDSLVMLYRPTVVPEDPGASDASPLDVAATVDQALWIALLARGATDPKRFGEMLRDRTVFLGVAIDGTLPDDPPFDLAQLGIGGAEAAGFRCPGVGGNGPAVLWRLWKHEPDPQGTPTFQTLATPRDTTGGLTRTGVVEITLPHDLAAGLPTARPSGGWDSPPPIDDADKADRVVAWLQVRRPPAEQDVIPPIRWVGINAVEVVQARTAPLELLGIGTGDSDQRFRLVNANVLPGTLVLEVDEPDGWRRWEEAPNFVGTKADSRRFTVERASGEVRFAGRGRKPQIGERIRVRSYRYGGGEAGRVAAKAITRAVGVSGVKVANPLPAWGGADPEKLDAALDRIPEELYRQDRAVTEDDFRALTLEVQGVARAEVLGRFHPDAPRAPFAGVVTVIVFPREDLLHPSAPTPDRPLLQRVCRHLDPRRLVTTELYVVPPTYRRIVMAVGVVVKPGYQVDAVRRWVELILRQYLAPVPPGGPEGGGWPRGRTVRRQELEAIAVQVEGVEYLQGLALAEPDGTPNPTPSDTVTLERWEVPELVQITVVEGAPLVPGQPYVPPAPADDKSLAPIPADVC